MVANSVLVVEDDRELQEVLVGHLQGEGYAVNSAKNLREALDRCQSEQYQLIIADILLEENSIGGIELAEALSQSTPIILISGNASREALKRAINGGVSRFLEKPFRLHELTKIMSQVLQEKENPNQEHRNQILEDKNLTPRERQVFLLLLDGNSNRVIAEKIATAERTVKAHLSSIFRKFGVKSRAELLSRLIR